MIDVNGLTKRFGGTTAVSELTFSVRPGSVTGFLGPNGAGKTTTMRVALDLVRPTSGSVTIAGRRYREHPAPLRVAGALLDARAVDGALSGRNHLRWLAQAGGIPVSRVDDTLALVGLTEVADRKVATYSLGMLQRLGIAGALLGDPPVLLFDEPANGLDADGIRWVRTFMRHLASEGRTVLVSSHLMAEMEAAADRVIVIGRGTLLADTTVEEFTRLGTGTHVRVVTPDVERFTSMLAANGATVQPDTDGGLRVGGLDTVAIGDLAAADGIRLHELTVRSAGLEETFMELTHDSVDYRAAPTLDRTSATTEPAHHGVDR